MAASYSPVAKVTDMRGVAGSDLNLSGFAGDALSSDENELFWKSTLQRSGGLDEDTATRIARIMSENDFPMPMPELVSAFTHPFLSSIGISRPSDRVRIILALQLCPAVPKSVDDGTGAATKPNSAGGTTDSNHSGGRTFGFIKDTETVQQLVILPQNLAFQWIDVIGKDDAQIEFKKVVKSLRRTFDEKAAKALKTAAARVIPRSMYSSSTSSSGGGGFGSPTGMLPNVPVVTVVESDGEDEEGPTVTNDMSGSMILRRKSVTKQSLEAFDVFNAPRPLPAFITSSTDPRLASFVLRVPTPQVDFEEATISSLTNKWVVVLDSRSNLIATVHRIDSAALCHLRQSAPLHTMTHRQLLMAIFMAFIADFNAVIDEVVTLLDECEVRILDKNQAQWLIGHLVHHQRRASVYDRLISLNEAMVRHVGSHYGLRDISDVDAHWAKLRERCEMVETRSSVLLNLVLALSGQRTADVMTVLTKVSMCISPLTVVTGIYGMNFRVMPDLEWEYSYYVTLLGMAAIVGVMLMWMKWIGL